MSVIAWSPDLTRREWELRQGCQITHNGLPQRCPSGFHRSHRDDSNWYGDSPLPLAFDHIYVIKQFGVRGLLLMPYGINDEDADGLTMWCREHHATWRCVGSGWHARGTVAIVINPRHE